MEQGQLTEEKILHESALLARRFVALAFCRADLLLELDDDLHILFCAGPSPHFFEKTTEQMIGRSLLDFVHEGDHALLRQLLKTGTNDSRIEDLQIRLATTRNPASPHFLSAYRVPDFDNNYFLAVKSAKTQSGRARQLQPEKDEQCGVLTDREFADTATERIKEFHAAGGSAKVTMLNVENLEKAIHGLDEAGQVKLMSAIGDILNEESLGGDTAGRIDDENFSFAHGADVNVDDINRKIETVTRQFGPGGVDITADAKTMDADPEGMTDDQMAKAIIFIMREFSTNKSSLADGGLSDNFQNLMAEAQEAMKDFRRICATRDFDLMFMPICNLKTKEIHHFEALTRFRGPNGGPDSSPYRMITMAEEIGMISEFDLAVARKSTDFVTKQALKGTFPPVAVNVSGHSIADRKFVDELQDLLKKVTNISRMISLEITESAEITDLEGVNAHIQEFRDKGFEVALDDFGAGAASFDYLNSFNVDTVKFDGPVVKRAFRTNKGQAFLASMAALCESIGVETIAEMVEYETQAKFLGDSGIHFGQGYFYGKPNPDPETFLRRKQGV